MPVPVGLNVWSRLVEATFPYFDRTVGPWKPSCRTFSALVYSGPLANQSRGSAARTRASGRPSSRRTMLVPSTSATHL